MFLNFEFRTRVHLLLVPPVAILFYFYLRAVARLSFTLALALSQLPTALHSASLFLISRFCNSHSWPLGAQPALLHTRPGGATTFVEEGWLGNGHHANQAIEK